MRVQFTLSGDEAALAAAYASDRGLVVHQIAKSLLLTEVKRHMNRLGLLRELDAIIERRLAEKLRAADYPKLGPKSVPHVGDAAGAIL